MAVGLSRDRWYNYIADRSHPPVASAVVEIPEYDPDHVYAWKSANNYKGWKLIARGKAGVDDREVIQSAIDLVHQRGGGTVLLGPNTFIVRSTIWLKSYVYVIGSGKHSTIVKRADGLGTNAVSIFRAYYEGPDVYSEKFGLGRLCVDGNAENNRQWDTSDWNNSPWAHNVHIEGHATEETNPREAYLFDILSINAIRSNFVIAGYDHQCYNLYAKNSDADHLVYLSRAHRCHLIGLNCSGYFRSEGIAIGFNSSRTTLSNIVIHSPVSHPLGYKLTRAIHTRPDSESCTISDVVVDLNNEPTTAINVGGQGHILNNIYLVVGGRAMQIYGSAIIVKGVYTSGYIHITGGNDILLNNIISLGTGRRLVIDAVDGEISNLIVTNSRMVSSDDICVRINADTYPIRHVTLRDLDIEAGGNTAIYVTDDVDYLNIQGVISNKPFGIDITGTHKVIKFNEGHTTENSGTVTFDGDGSTKDFLIGDHGLAVTDPSKIVVKVTPISQDAINASPCVGYIDPNDNTKIRVKFTSAPASGTNNVKIAWMAEIIS